MLLAVVAVAAAGFYITTRLNDDIRRHVEQTLADHYNLRGLQVSVEGARRIDGEGIRITGISIRDTALPAAHAELARIEELFLITDADLISLVQGKASAREIIVRKPTIRTTFDAENRWSATKLFPLPKFGERTVPVRVEGANLEIYETQLADRAPWKLRDINLRFANQLAAPQPSASALGASQATATDQRHIQGQLVCEHFGNVDFDGTYDVLTGHWQVKGAAADARLSQELIESLPQHVAAKVQPLAHVRGNAQIAFEAAKDANTQLGATFNIRADLKDGQLADPRLPYALGDLRVIVEATHQGIHVEHFTARHGQTTLELTGKVNGLSFTSPAAFTAKIRRLTLDSKAALASTQLQTLWNNFQPIGTVDIDAGFAFDGQAWARDVRVTCHDVGFTFHKFPYPLERGTGMLHLVGDNVALEVTAHSGSQPILIRGQLQNIGPQATGWVQVDGQQLTVDHKLLSALPASGAEMIQRLRGTGYFDFTAKLWREQPNERFHHNYKIHLEQYAIRFDRFPYPLQNITGKIDVADGYWTLSDLESVDTRRRIRGHGTKERPEAGGQLLLHFDATEVALDDQLRSALDPTLQELWDQLNPQGTLDAVSVDVRHMPGQSTADLIVRLEKDVRDGLARTEPNRGDAHPEAGARPTAESVSIRPEFFPYKFEKLGGAATYTSQNRRVAFESLRAEHKNSRLASGGYVDLGQNGGWTLRLLNASVDRLTIDHDLTLALPEALRDALADLNPTGVLNLRGDFQMSQNQARGPLAAAWKVDVNSLRTNLTCGDLLLENVSGEAQFTGQSQAEKFQSRVELALDAASYADFQCTDIRGPVWITNDQILAGSLIPKATANEQPRNLTARAYGGTLAADCRVDFGRVPTWALQASLDNGDLRRFANDKLPGKQNIEGKASADVSLGGTSQGIHTMNGQGKFRIRDAKMYDLPVMLAMLKLLRVREPSLTAFNRADVNFKVRGKYVYLDHIDFQGDAISLFGNGEMNLDGDVRMKLSAVLGREDFDLPLVRQLVTNFNQQIMTIHVDGTLDDPKVTNEPFPVLNRAIEQIQGQPTPTAARDTWTGRTRDYLRRTVPWPN